MDPLTSALLRHLQDTRQRHQSAEISTPATGAPTVPGRQTSSLTVDAPPFEWREEASSIPVRRAPCRRAAVWAAAAAVDRRCCRCSIALCTCQLSDAALPPGGTQDQREEAAQKAARLLRLFGYQRLDLAAAARAAADWILRNNKALPARYHREPWGVLVPALKAVAGEQIRKLAEVQQQCRQQAEEKGPALKLQAGGKNKT